MKDETYAFISDVKEKKTTARSARNMRTHCGKGGRVRLPSDNLSKKELMKMNGECKSYRLNDPMSWKEFRSMPDDIKVTYIKLIRQKFNAPDAHIFNMMGTNVCYFSKEMNRLGLNVGKRKCNTPWDKEGFYAWANGVDKLPTPVPERLTVTQEDIDEIEAAIPGLKLDPIAEPYVEEDLPFEEPDPMQDVHHVALLAEIDALKFRIDELLKTNEELKKRHAEDSDLIAWLQNKLCEIEPEKNRLEAQMEVVRLIFGGKNNGN